MNTMNTSLKCNICLKDCNDPIEYGEIFERLNIKVHYYCLLLSTHLPQRGKDTAGILGFLVIDIKTEIKNAASRFCCYCKAKNASIKCSSCDVYFHLKCALEENCLLQFCNEFKSYCHKHHNIKHNSPHIRQAGCFICRKEMGNYNPLTSITSDCCSTDGWVHRKCLKMYALAAGYYLKCLWCTNPRFRDYVRCHGIFVPDRDAAWETIKGAYADLYENIKKKCMASRCICPNGEEFNSKKWNMEICIMCGAFAIHQLCRGNEALKTEFVCRGCEEINLKPKGLITFLCSSQTSEDNTELNTSLYMSKSQDPTYSIDTCSLNMTQQNLTTNHDDFCIISSDSEEELEAMPTTDAVQTDQCIKGDNRHVLCIYDDNTLDVIGFIKCSDITNEKEFEIALKKTNLEENIIFPSNDSSEADEFLKKLIEEHLKNKMTDVNVIDLSDSDSDVSASKLLDNLEKKDFPVPQPKIFVENKCSNRQVKKQLMDSRLDLLLKK